MACGNCTYVCPMGAIYIDPVVKRATINVGNCSARLFKARTWALNARREAEICSSTSASVFCKCKKFASAFSCGYASTRNRNPTIA